MATSKLALTNVRPRIVYDVNAGAPTGPAHFPETIVAGADPFSDNSDATFARARGGGFDFANSLPGDWGKKDGFDVDFQQLTVDPATVTSVSVHMRYSAQVAYVDSPLPTEDPISAPPRGIVGLFLRPNAVPGYLGAFSQNILNSQGWIDLHRVGCQADGLTYTVEDAVEGTPDDERFQAKLATLAAPGSTLTMLIAGASSSEVAAITIDQMWLTVTYDVPTVIAGDLGDLRRIFS